MYQPFIIVPLRTQLCGLEQRTQPPWSSFSLAKVLSVLRAGWFSALSKQIFRNVLYFFYSLDSMVLILSKQR